MAEKDGPFSRNVFANVSDSSPIITWVKTTAHLTNFMRKFIKNKPEENFNYLKASRNFLKAKSERFVQPLVITRLWTLHLVTYCIWRKIMFLILGCIVVYTCTVVTSNIYMCVFNYMCVIPLNWNFTYFNWH